MRCKTYPLFFTTVPLCPIVPLLRAQSTPTVPGTIEEKTGYIIFMSYFSAFQSRSLTKYFHALLKYCNKHVGNYITKVSIVIIGKHNFDRTLFLQNIYTN
jgi:hypothetical protein